MFLLRISKMSIAKQQCQKNRESAGTIWARELAIFMECLAVTCAMKIGFKWGRVDITLLDEIRPSADRELNNSSGVYSHDLGDENWI